MNQKRPYLAKKGDMFAIGMMTYVLLTGTHAESLPKRVGIYQLTSVTLRNQDLRHILVYPRESRQCVQGEGHGQGYAGKPNI
eukprot:3394209-Amphidinium_carterae.1